MDGAKYIKLSSLTNIYLILIAIGFHCATAICVGSYPPTCLNYMEEEEAQEALEYILGKYDQVSKKIGGELLNVHGKRIVKGINEELHISFKYMDNTPQDILQYCTFILLIKFGECETIKFVCNTFLSRTPRPPLELETLSVCEEVPHIVTEETIANDEGLVTQNSDEDYI